MGEPETPHFYDVGIFGRVPEPQNQLSLSFETPGYQIQIRRLTGTFVKHIFADFKSLETPDFVNVGKDGRRGMMKIHLIISWTSWIWD